MPIVVIVLIEVKKMIEPTLKCEKTRKCQWVGVEDELVKRHSEKLTKEYGCEVNEYVCPKCGHDTLIQLRQ